MPHVYISKRRERNSQNRHMNSHQILLGEKDQQVRRGLRTGSEVCYLLFPCFWN